MLEAPRAAMARGDLEEALAGFGALTQAHPGHVPAVQGQIACLERAGRLEDALSQADAHSEQHGSDPRIEAKKGALLRQLGRASEARAALEAALEATKRSAVVQIELARLLVQQGDLSDAEAHLAEILARQPAHVQARLSLAALYERQHDLPRAIAICQEAPEPAEGDARIAARLGQLLRQAGDPVGSKAVLQEALLRAPNTASLLEELARTALASDAFAEAEHLFAQLHGLKPGYRPALFGRVSAALGRDQRAEARALLEAHLPEAIKSRDDAEIALRLLETGLPNDQAAKVQATLLRLRGAASVLSAKQVTRLGELAVTQKDAELLALCIDTLAQQERLPPESGAFLVRRAMRAAPPALMGALKSVLVERSEPASRVLIAADCTAFADGPEAGLAYLRDQSQSPRSAMEARAIARYLAQAGDKRLQRRYLRICHRRWPNAPWLRHALFQAHHASGDPEAARAFLAAEIKRRPGIPRAKLDAIDLLNQADPFAAYEALRQRHAPGDPIVGLPTWFQLAVNTGDLAAAETLVPALRSRAGVTAEQNAHFLSSQLGARYNELMLFEHAHRASGEDLDRFVPQNAGSYTFAAIKALQDWLATQPQSQAAEDVPLNLFQYWDRADPPEQIARLMARWQAAQGFQYRRFDRRGAQAYLRETFGAEHARAFTLARHVSEESDFLRLCVLLAEGGLYVDADDRRHTPPQALLAEAPGMVLFREDFGALANNVICAPAGHPLLERAVAMVLPALLAREADNTWSKTGPGLLTRAAASHVVEAATRDEDPRLTILPYHHLLRHISPHVRVPYKNTSNYWGNQGNWATTVEEEALRRLAGAAGDSTSGNNGAKGTAG